MSIIVCPLSRLPAIYEARRPSHVVTLLSPGSERPALGDHQPGGWLELGFHDIAAAADGLIAPDELAIVQLLAFARGWSGEAPLLIHCWAGVSRSMAAAFIIACTQRPDHDEGEIAAMLRQAAPSATPNRLMVTLADDMLGREGRMVAAVDGIGRGEMAFEGSPIEIALDPLRIAPLTIA